MPRNKTRGTSPLGGHLAGTGCRMATNVFIRRRCRRDRGRDGGCNRGLPRKAGRTCCAGSCTVGVVGRGARWCRCRAGGSGTGAGAGSASISTSASRFTSATGSGSGCMEAICAAHSSVKPVVPSVKVVNPTSSTEGAPQNSMLCSLADVIAAWVVSLSSQAAAKAIEAQAARIRIRGAVFNSFP